MRKLLFPTLITLILLISFSCATTPEENIGVEPESGRSGTPEVTVKAGKAEAEDAKNLAGTSQEKAVELKAPKAAPEEYSKAMEYYEHADDAFADENYSDAFDLYSLASEKFEESAEIALKKREEALAAMKAADEAISKTEKNSEDALEETGGEE